MIVRHIHWIVIRVICAQYIVRNHSSNYRLTFLRPSPVKLKLEFLTIRGTFLSMSISNYFNISYN